MVSGVKLLQFLHCFEGSVLEYNRIVGDGNFCKLCKLSSWISGSLGHKSKEDVARSVQKGRQLGRNCRIKSGQGRSSESWIFYASKNFQDVSN